MKRAIVTLTVSVLIGPALAAADQTPASQGLVDVAKAEEARRKSVRKPAKVYTNVDLQGDNATVRPVTATPAAAVPEAPSTKVPEVNLPGGSVPEATPETRNQAYWSGRVTSAQTALERSRIFADALQSRINALKTDFVNRDDPAQRAKIDTDLRTALGELDRVRGEIATHQKAIAAIEDEARRAGVPSGWLRPGA